MVVVAGLVVASSMTTTSHAEDAPADHRITVEVKGYGHDVVLVPGLASSREVWADLAQRLRPTRRLHLVQVAGFAGSPASADAEGRVVASTAEAIADYIVRERLSAPDIVGHSLGGEVALMLGARHPDLVGRLLVVDALPFYSLLFDPSATSASVAPQAAAMRDAILASSREQADAFQAASIARLVKTEAARPSLVEAGRKSDGATVANAMHELMTTDLRLELPDIKAQTMVVYAYDPAFGVSSASVDQTFRDAYRGLPNVTFRRVDDSFHFVMQDQPEAFAAAAQEFLAR